MADFNVCISQTNETHINEKSYIFTWVVKNLNLDLPLKLGQCITSPPFETDKNSYELKLHPGGVSNSYAHYPNNMVVEIPNRSALCLSNYRSNMCLVNKNGDENFHCLIELTTSQGSAYFHLERSKITKDFLPNGELTIRWKLFYYIGVEVSLSLPIRSIENIADTRRVNEFDDFVKLLNDSIFADIKIMIGTKKLFAHKSILAARSRYFAAMFESNMKEVEEGEIHITNVSAKIMQEILRFIYTGKIITDEEIEISDLLIAADMYGLDGLVEICTEAIVHNITLKNIGNILIVADKLGNAKKLKNSVIKFLTINAKALHNNKSFKKLLLDSLSHSLVVEIMNAIMSKI